MQSAKKLQSANVSRLSVERSCWREFVDEFWEIDLKGEFVRKVYRASMRPLPSPQSEVNFDAIVKFALKGESLGEAGRATVLQTKFVYVASSDKLSVISLPQKKPTLLSWMEVR